MDSFLSLSLSLSFNHVYDSLLLFCSLLNFRLFDVQRFFYANKICIGEINKKKRREFNVKNRINI